MHRKTHTKLEIQLVKTLRTGTMPNTLTPATIDPHLFYNYEGGASAAIKDSNKFAKWLANRISNHEVFVKRMKNQLYIFGDSNTYLCKLKDNNPVLKVKPKVTQLYSCIRCKADVKQLNGESLCHSCAAKQQINDKNEAYNIKSLHGRY